MRSKSVRTARLAAAGLAVLGFGGVASWAIGFGTSSSSLPEMSAAELIALRFLEVEFAHPVATDAAAAAMTLASTGESRPVQLAMLDPKPEPPAAEPVAAPAAEVVKPAPKVAKIPLPVARPAQAPRATQVAAKTAPARAATARSSNVLNDAQIAGIRKRLKLTPDQEQMWPAVEVALRNISYKKTGNGPATGGQMAYVDPDSAEVERLKSAAYPLIMRLNGEQRREVKMLAHVMGLTAVASRL